MKTSAPIEIPAIGNPVPPRGPRTAALAVVGEFPSQQDLITHTPFSSTAGHELMLMLHDAGIISSECYFTLTVPVIPPKNNIDVFFAKRTKSSTLPTVQMIGWQEQLWNDLTALAPKCIIACGELALWALTGNTGIGKWRGSRLEWRGIPVIPTYSPSMVLREWSWRYIAVNDMRRARDILEGNAPPAPEYEFHIRPAFEDVMRQLEALNRCANESASRWRVAGDIETRNGHIACLGLAWTHRHALCIPFMCTERSEGYWSEHEEVQIILSLQRLFRNPNIEWIFQNGLYDLQYFARHWGFVPDVHMDTMLAHHVCFAGLPKGLDFLSSLYCTNHVYWKDEGKTWDPALGEEQLWTYNCKDAVITFEVSRALDRSLIVYRLEEPFRFQMQQFHSVLRMMLRGVRQDLRKKGAFNLELMEAEATRQRWLDNVIGRPFNVRSPKQMKEFVYEELNLPVQRNRKTGNISCDEKALEKIAAREPLFRPIYQRISELRSIGVFRSTFVQMRLDHDGRVRCSYNVAGTETFRYSSSEDAFGFGGNLQNIPSGDESHNLPNVRKLFLPDPGHIIFDCDLDRADAQVVAWEANDDLLKTAFRAGEDIHLQNARDIFGNPRLTSDSKERKLAKAGVHATNYGAKPPTLSRALGITIHEAERFQKRWFAVHPGIADWHRRIEDQLATTRCVENKFGYRRYYFDRVESLLPEALAWIPQSTVALVIDHGLVNVDVNLPEVQVLLQVHDSLVMQCRQDLFPALKPRIREQLLVPVPYDDPLTIGVGLKASTISWGDCKEVPWD